MNTDRAYEICTGFMWVLQRKASRSKLKILEMPWFFAARPVDASWRISNYYDNDMVIDKETD